MSYRAPEPKPVLILLLAAAGAAAGGITGLLVSLVDPKLSYYICNQGTQVSDIFVFAVISGAGIGLGIGVSTAISRRLWVRLLLSPVFGSMGMMGALATGSGFIEPVNRFGEWSAWFGAPMGLAMLLAHHVFVQWRDPKTAIAYYSALGSLALWPFWYVLNWPNCLLVPIWMCGAAFGVFQFAAMSAALALGRKMSRDDIVVPRRSVLAAVPLALVVLT